MIKVTSALVVLCCASLAGCAANESAPDSASTAGDDCFHIRQINNWSALDKDHVYLEESGNDQFLLTMFSACPGLKFAQAIALSNRMGRVCPNDFGQITYRDGGVRSSCRIDNVERVTSKEEAVALVESRAADDEDQ